MSSSICHLPSPLSIPLPFSLLYVLSLAPSISLISSTPSAPAHSFQEFISIFVFSVCSPLISTKTWNWFAHGTNSGTNCNFSLTSQEITTWWLSSIVRYPHLFQSPGINKATPASHSKELQSREKVFPKNGVSASQYMNKSTQIPLITHHLGKLRKNWATQELMTTKESSWEEEPRTYTLQLPF